MLLLHKYRYKKYTLIFHQLQSFEKFWKTKSSTMRNNINLASSKFSEKELAVHASSGKTNLWLMHMTQMYYHPNM